MNGVPGRIRNLSLVVGRLAEYIEKATQRLWPNRHRNGMSEAHYLHAALKTICRSHRNAARPAIANMLLNLKDQLPFFANQPDLGVNGGKLPRFKFDIHHRTHHLHDFALDFDCDCHYVLLCSMRVATLQLYSERTRKA